MPSLTDHSSSASLGTLRVNGSAGPLTSVILLGGSIRSSTFHEAIGRWALALPHSVDQSGRIHTLLDAWISDVAALSASLHRSVPIRILADQSSEIPSCPVLPESLPAGSISIDKDPIELRGTGGVLRDISIHYSPDQFIFVANASQVLLRPLPDIVESLRSLHSDISVLAHVDGSPTTLMLVRCGSLAALPAVGFLDMKEQALPQLAASRPVHVVSSATPVARGVRTAKSYIAALRKYHLRHGRADVWSSAFQLVEPGAAVDPSTKLHDSVVLKDARIGKNVVLVRSVVCPGAVVDAGKPIVDKLVLSSGEQIPTEDPS